MQEQKKKVDSMVIFNYDNPFVIFCNDFKSTFDW